MLSLALYWLSICLSVSLLDTKSHIILILAQLVLLSLWYLFKEKNKDKKRGDASTEKIVFFLNCRLSLDWDYQYLMRLLFGEKKRNCISYI
jgi:hypothetical protein